MLRLKFGTVAFKLSAKDQSPDAYRAKNSFRASYWGFRTYKAAFLPALSLNATVPNFNRSIIKYQLPDGTYSYIEENSNSAYANMEMSIRTTSGRVCSNSVKNSSGEDTSTTTCINPVEWISDFIHLSLAGGHRSG